VFLYFKFLERDGNRGLGLLPLYSLDWIGLDCVYNFIQSRDVERLFFLIALIARLIILIAR